MGRRELLLKLGTKVTDRVDVRLGLKKLDENSPEYYGLEQLVTDEMAELALAMDRRVGITPEELARKTGRDVENVRLLLEEMAHIGIVEFDRENPRHEKQYVLPVFVPGSAELMVKLLTMGCGLENHMEIPRMFERLSVEPIMGITQMVPPGGAGMGMHVIPVEKAISHESRSVDVEHLSHWLRKYDKFSLERCSCRTTARVMNRGTGELEDECCIGVGDMAEYVVETGRGRWATYDEVIGVLKRAEDNGYVHQITNVDGENKIFVICNCHIGTCLALRTSQLFNTPNMSASAYRAHINAENCVACGKCVEVCPAGAAKLGQKLCTVDGPVKYPVQSDPADTPWSRDKWDENYRDDNKLNCHETGTAPCKTACPAHIAVQGYIKLAAMGRYMDALRLIKLDNPFPAVCGSICNRRCESACTRGSIDDPVAIDEIKKFIARREIEEDERFIPPVRYHRGTTEGFHEKVAVIGAGPAGMSCAYYLAVNGYKDVTVFDKNPMSGGMLALGIPSFRLEKSVVNAEIDVLRALGIKFVCGVEIGRDKSVQQLRDEGYKGFYLAIGAQQSAPLGIKGEELDGVYGGVDFMRAVNLGKPPISGGHVAVIGGGNVAMDVCRTAVRLGAEKTTVIYRRDRSDMPADPDEVAEAEAEGVEFLFLSAPTEFIERDGRVCGVKAEIMETGETGENGKRNIVSTGRYMDMEADCVICAVGQTIDWGSLDTGALEKGKKGNALADAVTYQSAQPDIFVGGDVYTGPKFAIDAIAAGREGAVSLHRYLHEGQSLTLGCQSLRTFALWMLASNSWTKPRKGLS